MIGRDHIPRRVRRAGLADRIFVSPHICVPELALRIVGVADLPVARRVVEALKKRGLRDNTLIIFHSDNGGNYSAHLTGETEVKGSLPASNAPYRGGKGDLYEGGTRVVSNFVSFVWFPQTTVSRLPSGCGSTACGPCSPPPPSKWRSVSTVSSVSFFFEDVTR